MYRSMVALLFLVSLSVQHGVVLIKGIPGCPPSRICEINGYDDIVANANNVPFLMSMLYNNGIEAAAVGGWNDHITYSMVLRNNGALAPYVPETNNACYAFCIPKGNGCNRQRHHGVACPPTHVKPDCNTPVCISVHPKKVECPPKPCHTEKSSCSEESCEDLCPKYVKQNRKLYKNKAKREKCKDRVCGALETIQIVKTFVFKSCDILNKKRIKFCEVTNKATDLIKWVELKPIFDGRSLTKEGYPTMLRFPTFLREFKKYIACTYEYKNPCLYLDCCGRLYVRIRETLYFVKFRKQIKYSRRHGFKDIKLCPVKGRELNKLIQSGLAGVVFEDKRSEC